jgi:hypothetical protein
MRNRHRCKVKEARRFGMEHVTSEPIDGSRRARYVSNRRTPRLKTLRVPEPWNGRAAISHGNFRIKSASKSGANREAKQPRKTGSCLRLGTNTLEPDPNPDGDDVTTASRLST